MTTRSGRTRSARSAIDPGSAASTGWAVASAAVPALPGAMCSSPTAGIASQRPEQGVLACTRADDEDAHVGQSIGPRPDRSTHRVSHR